jgi:hypothetical protein
VLAVVAGNGTVSGLGLEGLAVRSDESRGHETEGAEALGNDIGLDITIVVYKRLELRTGQLVLDTYS